MDTKISGIPSLHGPASINHGRRDRRQRGRGFEDAMKEQRDPGHDDGPGTGGPPDPLKDGPPQRRKDHQAGSHVDVLA